MNDYTPLEARECQHLAGAWIIPSYKLTLHRNKFPVRRSSPSEPSLAPAHTPTESAASHQEKTS